MQSVLVTQAHQLPHYLYIGYRCKLLTLRRLLNDFDEIRTWNNPHSNLLQAQKVLVPPLTPWHWKLPSTISRPYPRSAPPLSLPFPHPETKTDQQAWAAQNYWGTCGWIRSLLIRSHESQKQISKVRKKGNDQELIQPVPTSCPQNEKGKKHTHKGGVSIRPISWLNPIFL